jgi:DNA invertase Pin-like site-specific DNA recombinase
MRINMVSPPLLTGHGASINTATQEGKLVFGIFAALAEFERELISERTNPVQKNACAKESRYCG